MSMSVLRGSAWLVFSDCTHKFKAWTRSRRVFKSCKLEAEQTVDGCVRNEMALLVNVIDMFCFFGGCEKYKTGMGLIKY